MESRNKESGEVAGLTMYRWNNAVLRWKSDLQFYKEVLIFIQGIKDQQWPEILLHKNLDVIRESTIRLEN